MYVHISGRQLPYTSEWFYTISTDDGEFKDEFVSTVKLTAQETLDVQSYYRESLDGYVSAMVE